MPFTDTEGILEKVGLGKLSDFGTAAGRNVGTGAGQIPDMSAWTRGGDALNGWKRSPDGDMEQWGAGSYSDGQIVPFIIPFPTVCSTVLIMSNPDQTSSVEIAQSWPLSNATFRTACGLILSGAVPMTGQQCRWRAYGR